MTDEIKSTPSAADTIMPEDTASGENLLQASNPFDPERLALKGNPAETIGVKKALVHVPVRKPSRQEFFKVHPDPSYRMQAAILELKDEREAYLVTPEVAAVIPDEVRPCLLTTCISRQGIVFLWPVPLPKEDGREIAWHESARQAAALAETSWVRMKANMSLGAYDIHEATGNIAEPTWPNHTFQNLLEVAFGSGRLIDRDDHPVLKQLLGQA